MSNIALIASLVASFLILDVSAQADPKCEDADPSVETFYPIEGSCTEYLQCFNGVGNVETCPSGTWWHQAIHDCDYPGTYCSGWISEICKNVPPSEITYFPVQGNCAQFVECYDEVATVSTCPDGTWWHQEIENCDYPGSYCTENGTSSTSTSSTSTSSTSTSSTSTSTTSQTTTSEPTTNSPTTPGKLGPDPRCVDNNSNYWSHPAFCHRFIECYQGDSYEMMCPPNLYFSEDKKECVAADLSECCNQHECN